MPVLPHTDPPEPVGWWTELSEQRRRDDLDRWIDGIADALRADRIERALQLAHEVDMRAAGALSRDR